MRNLMRNFVTIVAALTAVVDGGKSFACPYLVRTNNWEIEEVNDWRSEPEKYKLT